jgi:hypothetical protein
VIATAAFPIILKYFLYVFLCTWGMRWLRGGPGDLTDAAFLAGVKLLVGIVGYLVYGLIGGEAFGESERLASLGVLSWLEWGVIERFVAERDFAVTELVGGWSTQSRIWRLVAAALGTAYDVAMLSVLGQLGRV